MLVNTLRWREEFDIKAIMQEDFPKDIFGNLGYLHGRDKEGRPVVWVYMIIRWHWPYLPFSYNIYGGDQNLKSAFKDVQRFVRCVWLSLLSPMTTADHTHSWRVALMEKSVALLDFNKVDQMIQIHGMPQLCDCASWKVAEYYIDYAGAKISDRDANSKAAASEASNIFQSHYPELLVSILASDNHCISKIAILNPVQEVLCQRAYHPHLDILGIQIDGLFRNLCKNVCHWSREVIYSESP